MTLCLVPAFLLLLGCASVSTQQLAAPVPARPLYVTEQYDQRAGLGDPIWRQGFRVSFISGRYDVAYEDTEGYYYAFGGRMSSAGVYVSKDGRRVYAWMTDPGVHSEIKGPNPPPKGVFLALRLKADFLAVATWDPQEFKRRHVPSPLPQLFNPGMS
jgi:hypothetical protein